MAGTYVLIADYIANGSVSSFNFTSIPSTYTDLVLIGNATSTTQIDCGVRFNSDTSTNYYEIGSEGSGTSLTSANYNNSYMRLLLVTASSTYAACGVLQINNYAESIWKTTFSIRGVDSTAVRFGQGTWAGYGAISSMTIYIPTGQNFRENSRFSLYGIARN